MSAAVNSSDRGWEGLTVGVRVKLGKGEQREGEAVIGAGEDHIAHNGRDGDVLFRILSVHSAGRECL